MSNITESLQRINGLDGALGSALVEFESGMCLGALGDPGFDLELAAAGNTEVVRAKKKIRDQLGLADKIVDILITLDSQYHLIRMVGTNMFIYLVLDKGRSNLALARLELGAVEHDLEVPRQ